VCRPRPLLPASHAHFRLASPTVVKLIAVLMRETCQLISNVRSIYLCSFAGFTAGDSLKTAQSSVTFCQFCQLLCTPMIVRLITLTASLLYRCCCKLSSSCYRRVQETADFYSAPQCSHCKRCTSYSNSVCLSVCPSVCQNDGT